MVPTATGIFVFEDIRDNSDVLSNADDYKIISTQAWFYDVNGKPDTKEQTSQPFLFDVTTQPDGSFFRSRSVVNQDSLDIDITHLVPATHFATLPAVLR